AVITRTIMPGQRMKLSCGLLVALMAVNARAANEVSPPEMAKLVNILSGSWHFTMNSKASVEHPSRAKGEGLEVWRMEPGGPLIEENHMAVNGKDSYDYAAIW